MTLIKRQKRHARLWRYIARWGFVVGTLFLIILVSAYFLTADNPVPQYNLAYQVWKLGAGRFTERYARPFLQDSTNSYLFGRPVGELEKRLGMQLYDGMLFPPSSYRGECSRQHAEAEPRERYLWFDDNANAFGWCVVVRDGKVLKFLLVKG